MLTNENKTHLSDKDVIQLLELVRQVVPPNSRLRGRGENAKTLRDRGFDALAFTGFLTTLGLPVSPSAVSKYLSANPATTKTNTPT